MPLRGLTARVLTLAAALGASGAAAQPSAEILVQPLPGSVGAPAARAALARYLTERTGIALEARTSANVLAHWRLAGGEQAPALILDEAHFTAYRVRRRGYRVLVKLPGLVGHSVVTAPGHLLLDVDDLSGRAVAAAPPPSLGTSRLLALFPDPVRRPLLLEAATPDGAVRALLAGRARAALIESRLVTSYPSLNVVMDAEPLPAPALSVSAARAPLGDVVRQALLDAPDSEAGRRLLDVLGVERFEPADAEAYEDHAVLLRGTWGYEP